MLTKTRLFLKNKKKVKQRKQQKEIEKKSFTNSIAMKQNVKLSINIQKTRINVAYSKQKIKAEQTNRQR